ncbi:MAG TPA: class I SAM-dependent methyltransferase [Candidatus Tumulicola sp.]
MRHLGRCFQRRRRHLARRLRKHCAVASQGRSSGRNFDRERGVTTHAVLFLEDLDPESVGDAGAHATHYEAVPVDDFRRLMRIVPPEAIAHSSFVDIGAGMGRALLLAMEFPFAQIIGVEISRALHAIATENLAKDRLADRRCRDVRLVCGDARSYSFPPGDLVLFLYNPFDAQALDDVLDRIAARRRRGTEYVLYHTPVHADRFLERGYRALDWSPQMMALIRRPDSGVTEDVAVALSVNVQQDSDGRELGKDGRAAEGNER